MIQINSIKINPNKPLIISDADEVLFMFLVGFEKFLLKNGLYLDLSKPRLNGNIKKISTDEYLKEETMTNLMPRFFKEETEHLMPIQGAAKSLKYLSKKCQIIILTNISSKERNSRIKALKKNNMDYPVITSSGLKGPVVAEICKDMLAPVFFIDDLPQNVDSVSKEYKDSTCIHFVQDIRLDKLMMTPKHIKYRLSKWTEIEKLILEYLMENEKRES